MDFDMELIGPRPKNRSASEQAVQKTSGLQTGSSLEKRQVPAAWNATRRDYPRDQCIHQLFETQTANTPDAVAVVFAEQQVTYQELNRRANQAAHYLQAFGVGPEVSVGLYMERSLDMVVALLGILKAGGVFVPLNPDYPPERLSFMLTDTNTLIILTQEALAPSLPSHSARLLCLDAEWTAVAGMSDKNPPNKATPENLAYIMYTSGSTGKPKGIGTPHRGVVRLVKGSQYTSFSRDENFLQLAPITFDASTLEIWGSLLNGGCLILFPDSMLSLDNLARVIAQYNITTLWLTAGLFHQMVEEHLEGLRPLRQLLAGGDVLAVRAVQKVLRKLPGCRLINGYGPTENTTFTCCYPMMEPKQVNTSSIPIGRPIANTQVYILDEQLQPVSISVAGELYTGGDGLARGYVNQPRLTAEQFIPNPFSSTPGTRLYKTGDLTRYLPDGNIEFLGRNDHQIKIRGFRVELGEIEAILLKHKAVRDTVIVAQTIDNSNGDKRLIAYVVLTSQQKPSINQLRTFLKETLPDYMVPASFVELKTLPLTPNGKVDRKALPAVDMTKPELDTVFIAPRTDIEKALAELWSSVLGVERIGIHDSFFELGGHSLLATQVISRILNSFQVEIPVRQLFQTPTIAGLAAMLKNSKAKTEPRPAATINLISRRDEEELLARLDELSEEELDELLSQLSEEEEG